MKESPLSFDHDRGEDDPPLRHLIQKSEDRIGLAMIAPHQRIHSYGSDLARRQRKTFGKSSHDDVVPPTAKLSAVTFNDEVERLGVVQLIDSAVKVIPWGLPTAEIQIDIRQAHG